MIEQQENSDARAICITAPMVWGDDDGAGHVNGGAPGEELAPAQDGGTSDDDTSGFAADISEGQKLFDEYFEVRGIPPETAKLVAKLLTPRQTRTLTGYKVWAVQFYYWNPDGSQIEDFTRMRFLEVRGKLDPPDGRPRFRFWQPKGSGSRLYQPVPVLRGNQTWLEMQGDVSKLLTVVEGEAEAIKLTLEGELAVALAGLWNYADRAHSRFLLKEFEQFELKRRSVEINFDNDVSTNELSVAALFHFSKALSNEGAEISSWQPPPGKAKGPGDYVTAFGLGAYKGLRRLPFGLAEQLRPYNETLAVIANPPSILKEGDGAFTLHKASELKDAVEKAFKVPVRQRNGKVRDCFLLDEWLEWGLRRFYTGINYVPGADRRLSDGKYNAWQSWGCPSIAGDVTPFLKLMRHLEPDEKYLRYVLQVIAYPIANPGAKLNVAGVLQGVPGAGKTLLTEILMAIYGHANVSKIGNRELGSQFNGFMAYRQLIICEEIKGDGDLRHDSEGMKEWITGSTVLVNEKYIKAHSVKNVANFWFVSNHRLPLFIAKNDRRYIVIETKTKLGNALGAEISAWARNGGISFVRHYLEHDVDFAGFSPTADARSTAAKLAVINVINAGCSAIEKFAQNVMNDDDRPVFATTRELYHLAETEIKIGPGKHTQLGNALEDADAVCVRERFRINPKLRSLKDRIWRLRGENEEITDDALRSALQTNREQRSRFAGLLQDILHD
jgi:hypothetical protein